MRKVTKSNGKIYAIIQNCNECSYKNENGILHVMIKFNIEYNIIDSEDNEYVTVVSNMKIFLIGKIPTLIELIREHTNRVLNEIRNKTFNINDYTIEEI